MEELVCYCFGFTKEDIVRDVKENQGRSEILEFIMDKKERANVNVILKIPKRPDV